MKNRPGYVARNMARMADKTHTFICISDYVKRLVQSYGIDEAKTERIYCSTNVEVEKEFPSSLREELGIDVGAPVVGTTGIWRPNKGFPQFIAAGEMIMRWNPSVKFLLGGKAYRQDSSYSTTIIMRARVLRALNAIFFPGYQKEVSRFMSALDIFVLPSDCEPFGLVLVEAMAHGLPVVATNAGGVPEIVKHNETGLLVPAQNASAMADAIYHLICNPLKRMQMGESAKYQVRKMFNKQDMVKAYEQFYLKTITGRA